MNFKKDGIEYYSAIINKIKNLVFDSRCIFCGKRELTNELQFICTSCYNSFFKHDFNLLCPVCKHILDENNKCNSCSILGNIYYDSYDFIQFYTGYFKNVLKMLKMNDQFVIIKLFYNLLIEKMNIDKNKFITVVPDIFLKKIKKGRAGLNYLLNLFKKNNFKILPNIIKKRFTFSKPQKMKNRITRLNEIKNIYFLPEENINKFSGEIYLIDDVYTTGSTVNYCSKLLKEAGFEKVYVITFFRALIGEY